MLTESSGQAFERDGILALRRAFSADDAARMQDVLWDELRTRHGIERERPLDVEGRVRPSA